jgi:hypothetical protein
MLQNLGNAAMEVGIGLLLVPGMQLKGGAAIGTGALVHMATEIGCNFGAGGKSPSGGIFCDVDVSGVCMEFDQGQGKLYQRYGDDEIEVSVNYKEVISIGCETGDPDTDVDSKGYLSTYRQVVTKGLNGELFSSEQILYYRPGTIPTVYSKPIITGEDSVPDGECTVKPRLEPYETTDANGCAITVQTVGMGETPGGKVYPIHLIEPGHLKSKWKEEKQWENGDPQVIGDTRAQDYSVTCNFAPTVIFNDYADGPTYVTIEPDEELGDALKRLADDINNRFNDVNGELQEIKDLLEEIDDNIDDDPVSIPAGTINFTAVCDYDQNGELKSEEYPVQGAATVSQALAAIHDLNTTLAVMIQQHLNWKTPTCGSDRPQLKGEWRSIQFISDETSPYGKSRLRKRLRYRSESGNDLGRLVDHWADFTWTAGPVCVQHKGSPIGTPQCWASSIDEGKRVLRHAFGEAGHDPDQVGEWVISGSNNSRYGVPGSMSVNTSGGYYWITCRDGPNGRPEVMTIGPNPYRLGLDKQF